MHRTSRQNLKRETACGTAIVAVCLFFFTTTQSKAADVYVVRFLTQFEIWPCPGVRAYRDQLFFYNTTGQDLTVRAVGGSNGYQPPSDPLVVPAGRSRSVAIPHLASTGVFNEWAPFAPYVFMINKLDVPDGIVVASRGESLGKGPDIPCSSFAIGTDVLGAFALPVVRALTPANVPELHLDSQLGSIVSTTNVGVYNGGSVSAAARIEVRAACNDRLLESRTVTIPPATLSYVTGFQNTFASTTCNGFGNAADYSRYVVVTMDQPGFSFVVTRADVLPPALPITSSLSR